MTFLLLVIWFSFLALICSAVGLTRVARVIFRHGIRGRKSL